MSFLWTFYKCNILVTLIKCDRIGPRKLLATLNGLCILHNTHTQTYTHTYIHISLHIYVQKIKKKQVINLKENNEGHGKGLREEREMKNDWIVYQKLKNEILSSLIISHNTFESYLFEVESSHFVLSHINVHCF